VAQNSSFDSAEGKVVRRLLVLWYATIAMLDLPRAKTYGMGIARPGQRVNDRPAGISKSKQLRHLVISFTSSIVAGAPDVLVAPAALPLFGQKQMSMAAGDHQCQKRKFDLVIAPLPFFQQNPVDVPFKMVHGKRRFLQRERERVCIADADYQSAGQAGPLRYCNGVNGLITLARFLQCPPDHGNYGAEMLARSQLRYHAAVGLMDGD